MEPRKRGVNAKAKVFVNSGGFIIKSRLGVIWLFGSVVIVDTFGNDERNGVG